MKIDHLTFGQLLKLASPENLMRVTQAYHKRLRRVWDTDTPCCTGMGADLPYSVWDAEECYPITARSWQRVLAFLRSSELKLALRRAAKDQSAPVHPGYWKEFRTLSERAFPNERTRWALGALIVMHVKHCGVPARLVKEGDLFGPGGFKVLAQTDEAGLAVIENRPGLKWETIKTFCDDMNVSADRVFWWLPDGDRTGWRINPSLWPVNTPDFQETAKKLIYENV